jgi:hypothetical protein
MVAPPSFPEAPVTAIEAMTFSRFDEFSALGYQECTLPAAANVKHCTSARLSRATRAAE